MNTETKTETQPRKLEKPVRAEQEMTREQLVTYAGESGGGGTPTTTGGGFVTHG